MNTYQSDIFSFLTTPDNFSSLVKAIDHYEQIKKELLQQFWQAVKVELKSTINGTNWQLHLDNNIFHSLSKLSLYKPNWKRDDKLLFSITWESLSGKPFRGLLLYMDHPFMRQTDIRQRLKEIDLPEGFESAEKTSSWWLWWNYSTDLDFNKPETLSNILPHVRTEKAKEVATDLFKLASEFEADLDKLSMIQTGPVMIDGN